MGSTALSLEVEAEELSEIVRAYQELCSAIIQTEGGYVAQLLGDGILAYFGYPAGYEDDSRRAVRAAVRIVQSMTSQTIRARRLEVRVGIHTGVVVIGLTGRGATRQPLAFGHAPNIAARVQSQAGPNEVLLTESTQPMVEGYFLLDDLGPRELTGISRPTRLYRVRGETLATSRLEARRRAGLTPFVGRRRELEYLDEHFENHGLRLRKVLLVRGDAGVGKSRLLEVARESLAVAGVESFQAFCSPVHQNNPLHPVASLFMRWLGLTPQDTDLEARRRLEGAMAALGFEDRDDALTSSLLSVFARGEGAANAEGSPQRRLRDSLQTIDDWLTRLACRRPILFVLEDAHWADPTTIDLVELFVKNPHSRVFACVSARPEFKARWTADPGVAELKLGPLSREEAIELVTRVAGVSVPERLADHVYVSADGNPLFLEEIMRARIEAGLGGQESLSSRGPAAPPQSSRGDIPASLHGFLMARLDCLGSARLLAQRASVLGRNFDEDVLLAIADSDATAMRQDLERLLSSGLVVDAGTTGGTYNFKHALIRDAAYASLLRPAKQEYHRRAAAALSRAPSAARQPDVIAMHHEEGGNDLEAIRHWQLAGKMASARSANREVIAHLERALALVERLPDSPERRQSELSLHLGIAPAFMAINGWAAVQVEASCRRALDLAHGLGAMEAALQALWGLWSVHLVRGEIDRALEASTQLLQASQMVQSPPLAVMANHAAAFTRYYRGDLDEARRLAETGIALFSMEQERFIVSQVQISSTVVMEGILALVLWLQGHAEEAEQAVERGGRLAEELNYPPSVVFHLSLRNELRLWQGDAPKLRESAERMLRLANSEGFELFASTAYVYRGLARASLGDRTDGIDEARLGWEAYAATGAGLNIVQEHCRRAEALAAASRPDEALALLDEAEQRVRDHGEKNCDAEVHRVRAEIGQRPAAGKKP